MLTDDNIIISAEEGRLLMQVHRDEARKLRRSANRTRDRLLQSQLREAAAKHVRQHASIEAQLR